jgi:hypothetical protein
MPDLSTFDRERRTVSIRCAICRWKFRCSVEQLTRVICRTCESNQENAHAVPKAT